MPVLIVNQHFKSTPITPEVLIATIERNRDRIRNISGMLLTVCGLLVSASTGFTLFITDKKVGSSITIASFGIGALCFLSAAVLSVIASFLRTSYTISSQEQFLTDLLRVFHVELRLARLSLAALLAGLLSFTIAIVVFFWGRL